MAAFLALRSSVCVSAKSVRLPKQQFALAVGRMHAAAGDAGQDGGGRVAEGGSKNGVRVDEHECYKSRG